MHNLRFVWYIKLNMDHNDDQMNLAFSPQLNSILLQKLLIFADVKFSLFGDFWLGLYVVIHYSGSHSFFLEDLNLWACLVFKIQISHKLPILQYSKAVLFLLRPTCTLYSSAQSSHQDKTHDPALNLNMIYSSTHWFSKNN